MAKSKRIESSDAESDDSQIRLQHEEDGSDVDVDFQFENLTEDDFHGVSLLIKNLLAGEYNSVSLAETITEQQNIGCAVKTGDDSAICAIGTVLNPHQYRSSEGVKQLKGYILRHATKHAADAVAKQTQRLLAEPVNGIVPGIVIKERLVNLPMQLAPGMHRVLVDDISWSLSTEAECPAEEAAFYRYTHLVFISFFLVDPSAVSGGKLPEKAGKVKKAKKRAKIHAADGDRIYIHAEDEIFLESAEGSFSWVEGEHDDGKVKYQKHRLVYMMTKPDYLSALTRLEKAL